MNQKIQDGIFTRYRETVNVMSWKRFYKLQNIELNNVADILRCANDSTIKTISKRAMEIEIDSRYHTVTFTIVQLIIPKVIEGVGLKKLFGMELQ